MHNVLLHPALVGMAYATRARIRTHAHARARPFVIYRATTCPPCPPYHVMPIPCPPCPVSIPPRNAPRIAPGVILPQPHVPTFPGYFRAFCHLVRPPPLCFRECYNIIGLRRKTNHTQKSSNMFNLKQRKTNRIQKSSHTLNLTNTIPKPHISLVHPTTSCYTPPHDIQHQAGKLRWTQTVTSDYKQKPAGHRRLPPCAPRPQRGHLDWNPPHNYPKEN